MPVTAPGPPNRRRLHESMRIPNTPYRMERSAQPMFGRREQTSREEFMNSLTHGVAAALSIAALTVLPQ